MGRPAASAEVQPSGRRAFEFRFQTAPESAFQPRAVRLGGVELVELALALADDEDVAVAAAFDRRVLRDRVRAGVALVAVGGPGDRARAAGSAGTTM